MEKIKMEEEPVREAKTSRIRVCVRCRPESKQEKEQKEPMIIKSNGNALQIINPEPGPGDQQYYIHTYDFVYGPLSSTADMYREMAHPMVLDMFSGLNGTIFACECGHIAALACAFIKPRSPHARAQTVKLAQGKPGR